MRPAPLSLLMALTLCDITLAEPVRVTSPDRGVGRSDLATPAKKAESLKQAVRRINEQLEKEHSSLGAKPLTTDALRDAIQRTIAKFAAGKSSDRAHCVATLTRMLETDSIPPSVPFGLSVTRIRSKEREAKYSPDEYVGTVSLNYCFSVWNEDGTGIRIVGLSGLAEAFDVVRRDLKGLRDDE